ncbi:MAG TPA: hypothetical protein VFS42_12415 [Burkholderiaceae bacterium]|nr:hypothetical protein [Burkholderiaceae bacterium]
MRRLLALNVFVLSAVLLAGCATLTKESRQTIDVQVFDSNGRAVSDAACRLDNWSESLFGNSPLIRVSVERSGSDLVIECRKPGLLPARAIAVSRATTGLIMAIQPIATTVIDHLTGRMYDYPHTVRLVIGRERVFVEGRETPVSDEPLPIETLAGQPK